MFCLHLVIYCKFFGSTVLSDLLIIVKSKIYWVSDCLRSENQRQIDWKRVNDKKDRLTSYKKVMFFFVPEFLICTTLGAFYACVN